MKILPERPSSPGDDLVVRISRMRRRHVRAILKIEQQVYPRPWSAAVFASEIDQIAADSPLPGGARRATPRRLRRADARS